MWVVTLVDIHWLRVRRENLVSTHTRYSWLALGPNIVPTPLLTCIHAALNDPSLSALQIVSISQLHSLRISLAHFLSLTHTQTYTYAFDKGSCII